MLLFWPFGQVPEVEATELARELDDWLVLDVRTVREFRNGHISTARSLPITSWPDALERVADELALDRQRRIVTVCLTAHRSVGATRLLRERGFERAVQLAGGMRAWWRAALPVARG